MTRSRSGSKRCAKARCEGAALDELGCTGLVLCLVVSEREPRAAAARGGRTRARGAGAGDAHGVRGEAGRALRGTRGKERHGTLRLEFM